MSVLDMVFALIAFLAVLRGVYRGAIREVAAIAGLVLGIYFASHYYQQVGEYLLAHLGPSTWVSRPFGHIGAYVLIVLSIYIVFSLLRHLLRNAFTVIFSATADRALGGFLGFLEATILSAAVLMALTAFLPAGHDILLHSRLAPHFIPVADRVAVAVPGQLCWKYRMKKLLILGPGARGN
ncbi:MAG: CvpA family protein [Pseudomonadota bacterium]